MGSKYRWFDFASPAERMAAAYDRTVGGGEPATSPPSSKPEKTRVRSVTQTAKGEKVKHTAADIARAKGKAVGGKSDKCKKGKACSATCIYVGDDCILDLDATMSGYVSQVRDLVVAAVKGGRMTEEEGIKYLAKLGGDPKQKRDEEGDETHEFKVATKFKKAFDKAHKELEQEFPNPADRLKAIDFIANMTLPALHTNRDDSNVTTKNQVEGLLANENYLRKVDEVRAKMAEDLKNGVKITPEEANRRMAEIGELSRPYAGKITPGMVSLAIALMPDAEQKYLSTAGALKEGGGLFSGLKNMLGNAVPTKWGSLKDANAEDKEARLRLLTLVHLENGAKDVYTGQLLPFSKADLEHKIPFEAIGNLAEVGNNMGLTASNFNRAKSKGPAAYLHDLEKGFLVGKTLLSRKKTDPALFTTVDGRKVLTKEGEERLNNVNDRERKRWGLVRDIEQAAASAPTSKKISEVSRGIQESDFSVPEKTHMLNKLMAGMTGAAETARAGYQSGGRDEQPWYWMEHIPTTLPRLLSVAMKLKERAESGDDSGWNEFVTTMKGATARIKQHAEETVPKNRTVKGKEVTEAGKKTESGEETTGLLRAAVDRETEKILQEVEKIR
jgi:hypothetical protein